MQAGQYDAAQKLIVNNQKQILDSEAKILVVSCPICYKVFKQDYVLPGVEVKHHSEYLLELVQQGKLKVSGMKDRLIYHDPCDLGRGSQIYEQPRELLKKFSVLVPMKKEKDKAFCCGGSLANIKINNDERGKIRDKAVKIYQTYRPDFLVTACPLCKKTFAGNNSILVQDIAELVWKAVKNWDKQQEAVLIKKQMTEIIDEVV